MTAKPYQHDGATFVPVSRKKVIEFMQTFDRGLKWTRRVEKDFDGQDRYEDFRLNGVSQVVIDHVAKTFHIRQS